jgi:hypothetical protein
LDAVLSLVKQPLEHERLNQGASRAVKEPCFKTSRNRIGLLVKTRKPIDRFRKLVMLATALIIMVLRSTPCQSRHFMLVKNR